MSDCRVVQRIISEADDLDLEAFDPEIRRHIGSCNRCSRYLREMASVDAAFAEFLVPGEGVTLAAVASQRASSEQRLRLAKAAIFLVAALSVLAWSLYANSQRVEWFPYGAAEDPVGQTCSGQ